MKKILMQFCRFSLVGIAAFLIDYGLLFVFTESLQMHYLLSSMLSFTVATVFNYIYSTKYVFVCREEQSKTGQFVFFVLLSACGLLLNSLFMKILVERMELHYMFAKLISGVVVSIWNFASRKIFLEEDFRVRFWGRQRQLFRDRWSGRVSQK